MRRGRRVKPRRSRARRKFRMPKRKARKGAVLRRKIKRRLVRRIIKRARGIKRRFRVARKKTGLKLKRRKIGTRKVRELKNAYVRDLLMEVAGEKALKIASGLGEPVTDEELAGFCKIKISDVRAVLNKLHSYGLATYRRTRDKDSGWYSYIWNLTLGNAPKRLEEKKAIAAGESTYVSGAEYYVCDKHGELKIPFEIAFENKFRCLECGSPLSFVEAPLVLKEAKKR
jgi:transcription initiation factor TFIIE subunit alpha